MWQVLGSVCLMLRMVQLAVHVHATSLHDHLDDYVDAPPDSDHVTPPMNFRSRDSKHAYVVG